MSITVTTNFDVNTDQPMDSRRVVDDITARDAIVFRYEGLKVFVKDRGDSLPGEYQLQGGVTNNDWAEVSQGIPTLRNEGIDAQGLLFDVPAGCMSITYLFNNTHGSNIATLDIGTTLGGSQIVEDYEIDPGWNMIEIKIMYPTKQSIYLGGDFNDCTLNVYLTYQKIL